MGITLGVGVSFLVVRLEVALDGGPLATDISIFVKGIAWDEGMGDETYTAVNPSRQILHLKKVEFLSSMGR
jgi:hypothetical protein